MDTAQDPADVRDRVTLGIAAISPKAADRLEYDAAVPQQLPEPWAAAGDEDRFVGRKVVGVVGAVGRQSLIVADLELDVLVAGAAGDPDEPVEQPEIGLDERREASEVGLRHPGPVGLDEILLGPVEQHVEAQGQVERLEARHRPFVADLGAELARQVGGLVEQIAGRIDVRILERVGHQPAENVPCAAEEGLDREIAAAEILVGQGRGEQFGAVRRRIALDLAASARRRNPERTIAGDQDIISIAFELEAVGDQLHPGARAERETEAAERRPAVAVLDFALGAVDADIVAVAVAIDAAPLEGGADIRIEGAGAITGKRADLAAQAGAVEAVGRCSLEQCPDRETIAARSADRDLVDDSAGAADPLERVGAVNDLDPVDEEGIDRVAVTRSVADRRRLGDAVDRVERRSAAQALAGAGQFLSGRRERGQKRRDRVDGRPGHLHLLPKRLGIDDVDRQRQRTGWETGAGGGDDDVFLVRLDGLSGRDARPEERDGKSGGGSAKRHEDPLVVWGPLTLLQIVRNIDCRAKAEPNHVTPTIAPGTHAEPYHSVRDIAYSLGSILEPLLAFFEVGEG